jgi:hypothetical protein
LQNYFLSDDTSNLKKWQFGAVNIAQNSFLLIFASDQDTINVYPHSNFKISSSGELIILSDTSGKIIDSIYIPELYQDISFGRINDGMDLWRMLTPTPGLSNSAGNEIGISDSVAVSLPGGFYAEEISLELSAGDSEIYYTLDGSDPDSNSAKYTAPISITKTSVLKSFSLKKNNLPSQICYQTYFINENTDLPVISIIADPFDLFDADSGIYTNYSMDWEKPAHVEFFEDDKSLGFKENCGIEIYGNQSATAPQKSISVKFKDKYGASKIDYALFPEFPLTTFKAFVLRNSGNDFQYTHLRDAVMQKLMSII